MRGFSFSQSRIVDGFRCFFAALLTATRGTKTKKYETSLQIQGGGEKLLSLRSRTFFTAIIAAVTISSCSNEETFNNDGTATMTVKVNNNIPASRGLVTGQTLPAQSSIGVWVYEEGETTYDGNNCTNIPYTTTNGTSWAVTEDGYSAPKLSATAGKTIAYYPWAESVTDFTQIPVTTAEQEDYMYSNEVDVSFASHEATYTMNHALTGIRLTVKKNDAHPDVNVTKVTAQSDGFATSATLDATTGALSSVTGSNETLTHAESFTTTTAGKEIGFVTVPAASATSVTFMVETDGDTYTATATMAEAFKQGFIYDYKLTFNAEGLTLSSVKVNTWQKGNGESGESLDLQKYNPWGNLADGVYAVSADWMPVEVANATSECVAVALIQGEHMFMIEKNETANAAYDGNTYLYWDKDCPDLTMDNYTKADGTNADGYLPQSDGTYSSTPNLSGDYTTWTSGALSDFNGKTNTGYIVEAASNAKDMGTILKNFNAATDGQNQGKSDWYIPACGQLALMYLNMTNINAALEKIGATEISAEIYWSSSEYSSNIAWYVRFSDGNLIRNGKGANRYRVRFVRDIE